MDKTFHFDQIKDVIIEKMPTFFEDVSKPDLKLLLLMNDDKLYLLKPDSYGHQLRATKTFITDELNGIPNVDTIEKPKPPPILDWSLFLKEWFTFSKTPIFYTILLFVFVLMNPSDYFLVDLISLQAVELSIAAFLGLFSFSFYFKRNGSIYDHLEIISLGFFLLPLIYFAAIVTFYGVFHSQSKVLEASLYKASDLDWFILYLTQANPIVLLTIVGIVISYSYRYFKTFLYHKGHKSVSIRVLSFYYFTLIMINLIITLFLAANFLKEDAGMVYGVKSQYVFAFVYLVSRITLEALVFHLLKRFIPGMLKYFYD